MRLRTDPAAQPKLCILIFTAVNFMNYLDRGIIAGAGTSIKGCVHDKSSCIIREHQQTCGGGLLPSGGDNTTLSPSSREESFCSQCKVCGDICDGVQVTQTGLGLTTSQLGMLQSSFMVAYSVACLIFANAVHRVMPFRVVSFGYQYGSLR